PGQYRGQPGHRPDRVQAVLPDRLRDGRTDDDRGLGDRAGVLAARAAERHGSRVAIPQTCGAAGGGIRLCGKRNASDWTTVNPAPAIVASVSRLTWHPPPNAGHTVASSTRCTRRRPEVPARTCSMKR